MSHRLVIAMGISFFITGNTKRTGLLLDCFQECIDFKLSQFSESISWHNLSASID